MASLGWVSPRAATEGVSPIFSEKKLATILSFITVCQFSVVTPIYFLLTKLTTLFRSSLSLLLISLGCHPNTFFTCPTSFVHNSL